jgi:hypothetical protein
MTDTNYLSVIEIEEDTSSDLSALTNGADHITISHQDFLTEALGLSAHRSDAMRALTIDIQDVYDEFNFGIAGAVPIRNFLTYAYHNWQPPAPSYVVLVGDGHYDPKQNYYSEKSNFIPPYLLPVDPWIGETASDNRYVTIVGQDTLPDMMIGRLPVNDSTQANAMITKIINYETDPDPGDWQQQVLAVADNADYAGDFAAISDYLLNNYLAPQFSAEKVYYGVTHDLTSAKQAILDNINSGKLIVNYIGHSGITAWGDQLLKASQVDSLINDGKYPVMLDMTCYDGSFHYPDMDALAEVASRAEGKGSVAHWSSTGEGVASGHIFLNTGFFKAFMQDGVVALGDAVLSGKFNLWSAGGALELLDTYTLFGDPGLTILRPETTNHPPVITEGSSVNVTMSEDGSPTGFSLTLHATDIDGDVLNWQISGEPFHGSAVASGTGVSIDVDYTPGENYNGSDMILIQVSDGAFSDQILVNIQIDPVNDPPVAVPDTIFSTPNTSVIKSIGFFINNDTDIDNDNSELSVIEVLNPTNGEVALESGLITFMPAVDFSGMAGFNYILSDGELTDMGDVTVYINTRPTAIDDNYYVEPDQVLTIVAPGVLDNDIDLDGDSLTAKLSSGPTYGSLTLNADGSFTYTPIAGYIGTDSFSYYANDGVDDSNLGLVTITINESMTSEVHISLLPGWNLVSFNLIPEITLINDVLSSISESYTLVYAWNTETDSWMLYDPAAAPYSNDLTALDHKMGFWINMSISDTLVVSGTQPKTTEIPLMIGWNLVGYPAIDPQTLPDALENNGIIDYSMVMAYHAADADLWKMYDPSATSYVNDLLELSPGWGYWINVGSNSTWTVTYDQP